jgi:predicted O-linked N-acetylglucosamine transferase (SPINDLY family)/glycosyltransferase involved in cell wall biosynthesis
MQCKICGATSLAFGQANMLNKYNVDYFQCSQCRFVQTESPYWLKEAYGEAITGSDVGLVHRNLRLAESARLLINQYFSAAASFLDYGGGYGLFVRLMRDRGFDFYWYDKFCQNLLAQGFEGSIDRTYELVTAFELVEHFVDPKTEIQEILQLSDSFLFSTELLPDSNPTPESWWYYAPHEGQHIAIFTERSLQLLAVEFGLNFYTNGRSLHLLTRKTFPPDLFFTLNPERATVERNSLLPQDAAQIFALRQGRESAISEAVEPKGLAVESAIASQTILIDGVFFQLYRTGIARLWQSVLEEWSSQPFSENIVVLDRAGTCPKIPGIRYREIPEFNYQTVEADREMLQSICDAEGADLFISTYYTTPLSTPSVFMGYDMIPEVLEWDLAQPMWQCKHHAIRHAIGHITISQNTAQDLQQCFPELDAANITPILCGVAEYFKPASEFELLKFRDRYNLRKPYFLLVGASLGYKNAGLFLSGLAQLASRQGFEVVCTGGSALNFSAEARKLLPDVVFHPLYLDDDELRAAYGGAIALVYPSQYEGFGLPVVEALKCGCPVITCPNASIPEVGGDAVIYIDDQDVNAMSEALLEVQKPQLRQHLIQAGYQQAQQFTWAAMATQMQTTLSQYLARSSRSRIAEYEAAIAEQPDDRQLYWRYGLALLRDGQEEEAQATWLMVLAEAGEEEAIWLEELRSLLTTAIMEHMQADDLKLAWVISQHLRELVPNDIENLLHLLALTIANQTLDLETFHSLQILETIATEPPAQISPNLLMYVLDMYLANALIDRLTVDLVEVLADYAQDVEAFVQVVLNHAHRLGHEKRYIKLAIDLVAINLKLQPEHYESLLVQSVFGELQRDYPLSVTTATAAIAQAQTPIQKLAASRSLLNAYLSAGKRDAAFTEILAAHRQLVEATIATPQIPDLTESYRIMLATMHLPYLEDQPQQNRLLQNQVLSLCEQGLRQHHRDRRDRYQALHADRKAQRSIERPLRVGYVCNYFYQHSVGWLARWLLKHHDPNQVELYIYIINPRSQSDYVHQQYVQMSPNVRSCPLDAVKIAEQVIADEIDILVELDSLTCQVTCELMALKSAPIQVTWLGWDAVGMAAIDYYLVDNYVLPADAQDYYVEKLVRLPQTYIAVDGFEIGLSNLSRQSLGISGDAIVYMTAQRGYKRHPEVIRMQMEILKQVPNSYLLIKGIADEMAVQEIFSQIAQEVGVAATQLRFLPMVESEEVHRANLAIADVILDTFPYNGATTTLEALWMERPLVTRVGEQFAARNSYTMLKNVGVEIGIAWSDAEYIDWGVKLGLDANLRKTVVTQLKQAKRSAPLWNTKQFAAQVEAAYQKMWQKYLQS